jgi:hypothetical protein
MFYALGLIFGCTEGIGSRFHVLHAQTRFRRYQGRRVPFSCFAGPNSFSTVSRASSPVFMFCTPGLVFGGTVGVGSRFHVLRAQTRFQLCRVRRVPFSCFMRPGSFSAVPRASGRVFMFCALGLVFDGTVDVRSRFHVLPVRNHFRRYRGRRVPLSSFALPDSFSMGPSASGRVFMFCAPRLVFDGTERVRSRFHVLCARTYFCATLFRALRTAAGRWDAEEGHGDPSQACICLMPADSAV